MDKYISKDNFVKIWAKIKGIVPTKLSQLQNDNNTVRDASYVHTDNNYTKAEKDKLAGIAAGANNYSHPTNSGNKHIPSGGSAGQILRWSADGTAVWGNDNNTTYGDMRGATASAAGASGLVPAPKAGAQGTFLRGDGTWASPANTTYQNATTQAAGLMSKEDKTKLNTYPATYDSLKTDVNSYVSQNVNLNNYYKKAETYSKTEVDTKVNSAKYTLPTASAAIKGGVKIGAGLTITGDVLSVNGGGTADHVDWSGITNKPSTFAPSTHTHPASQVTGLAKVATSGSYNDLANKPTIPSAYTLPVATTTALGGVKSSDTGKTAGRDYKVQINSDGTMKVNVPWTDNNTTYQPVTQSANGLMTAGDKVKLDNIAVKATADSAITESDLTTLLTSIFG